MQLQIISANAAGDAVRYETLRGSPYLVAPVVLVREGVLNGDYLDYSEIQSSVTGWNGRPITAPPEPDASGHPRDDGEFVSANSPDVREEMTIGEVLAVHADDDERALKGEAWLSIESAKAVGDLAVETLRRIARGEQVEVSTGYFRRLTQSSGTHNGEEYENTQHDLMPDHLAMLPNEVGACSWEDGCGTPRVEAVANLLDTANVAQGDVVRWSAAGGTAYGRVRETVDEDGQIPASDIVGDGGPINGPAALIEVYRPGEDGWEASGEMVGHKTDNDTLDVLDDGFPNAANATGLTAYLKRMVRTNSSRIDPTPANAAGAKLAVNAGGNTETTIMNTDITSLAEETAFDLETLKEMSDERVATLSETVNDDGSTDDPPGDGGDDPEDGDDAEVEALRERVATLESQQEESEREQYLSLLTTHTEHTEETLGDLDTGALETLADDLDTDATADTPVAGTNYAGRGGASEPVANAGDEPETEEWLAGLVETDDGDEVDA